MKDSNSTETTRHIVPCEPDANALLHNRAAGSNFNTLSYIHSSWCEFLCLSNVCKECSSMKPVKEITS